MHWYSWGGCDSNLPFAKAIPNVQLFQIPNGRALIYQPWDTIDKTTSRTSSRTLKNLSLSSSNRSFDDLRKLTIECILVCTSFKVTMSLKNIVLSIHISQAFPLKHYSIGGKGSKRISITQVKFHHHGDWWGEEEESVIDLGIYPNLVSRACMWDLLCLPLILMMMMMNFNYPHRVQSVVHEQSCAIDNPKCVKWFQMWQPLRQIPQIFTFSNP